jgi:hypothetical protein
MTDNRKRVALIVFADVDSDIGGAHHIAERALRGLIGPMEGETHTVRMSAVKGGTEFAVRFHDVMEAGMAAGNGYLWTQVTSKAFRQYEWQFAGEEDES